LRGKEILVKTNSTAHYALLGCLRKLKLTGQVKLVPMETSAVPSAFGGGRAAAAMTWPPFDKQFVNDPGKYLKVCTGAAAGAPSYNLFGLTQDFLRRRPVQARKFLRAAYAANAWIPAHRAQAGRLLSEYYASQGTAMSPEDAGQELRDIRYFSPAESIRLYRGRLTADLDRLGDTFVDLGFYQSKPDVPTIVRTGLRASDRIREGGRPSPGSGGRR
jgi:ABC-type nitrate/sulfonate/bicarbonate transport system substrate-binding protein